MGKCTLLGLVILLSALVARPLRGEEDWDKRVRAASGPNGGHFIPQETGRKAFQHVRQAFEHEVRARGIEATKKALWDFILYRAPDAIPDNEVYEDPFVEPFVQRMVKELPYLEVFLVDRDARVTSQSAQSADWTKHAIADMAAIEFWRFLGENADDRERQNLSLISDPTQAWPEDWAGGLASFGGNSGNMDAGGSFGALLFYEMRGVVSDEERLDFLFKKLREHAAYTSKNDASQSGMQAVTTILEYSFHPRTRERLLAYLQTLPQDALYSTFEHDRLWRVLTLQYPVSELELLGLLNAPNPLPQLLAAVVMARMKDEAAIPTLLKYCGREAAERFMAPPPGGRWEWDSWAQVYCPFEDAFAALCLFAYRKDIFDYFVWGVKWLAPARDASGNLLMHFVNGVAWGLHIPAYQQEALEVLKWFVVQRGRLLIEDKVTWTEGMAWGQLGRIFLVRYPDSLTPDEFLMLEMCLLREGFSLSKTNPVDRRLLRERWTKRRKELQEAGLIPALKDIDIWIHPLLRREFEADPDFSCGPLPPPREDENSSSENKDGKEREGKAPNRESPPNGEQDSRNPRSEPKDAGPVGGSRRVSSGGDA
jgi:hypothetical protein